MPDLGCFPTLRSKSQRAINKLEPIRQYLLITRYSPDRVALHNMLSVKDITDMLGIPLLGTRHSLRWLSGRRGVQEERGYFPNGVCAATDDCDHAGVGVVPESEDVLNQANLGQPVLLGLGDASHAYKDTVRRQPNS